MLLDAAIALFLYLFLGLPSPLVIGIMCGAVTNTPSLGATQQVITEFAGKGAPGAELSGMGYAVAYPFGVLGVILVMMILRIAFKIKVKDEVQSYQDSFGNAATKLESVKIAVANPNLFGKSIGYI